MVIKGDHGPLSQLFLAWVFPLLRLGFQRPLEEGDHLELPTGICADKCSTNFWAHHQPGGPILATLWKVHRRDVLVALALGCLGIIAKLASTLLVRAISGLLLSEEVPQWQGLLYAAGVWACSCIDALSLTHGNLFVTKSALGVYATFATVTYAKSKSLHPYVRPKHKRGSLVNLALSETARFVDSCLVLLVGVVAPLQLLGSVAVALSILGPVVLVMLVWVALVAATLRMMAKKQSLKFREKMKFQSQRISTCNEMLQAVKMVKFQAWEEQFEGLLNGQRKKEERVLFQMRLFHSLTNPVCNMLPMLACLSIFGIYIAIHGRMPALPDVFALVQIVRSVSIPFTFMGLTLSSIETLLASSRRLTALLSEPDVNRDEAVSPTAPPGWSISVHNGTFAWTDGEATIKDVCLSVPHGQLVFIVGHLGQGKSSLMGALLGDMAPVGNGRQPHCSVDVAGGLAYAPQQAFVMNATVRDNVLFGRPFEEKRYAAALHAAALDADLEVLPAGDETEIGEKGVTLSGGQRARVGLARMAYANAGLSLLDDPFAALDMEVGRHVFDHLLCGALDGAARLVTSSQVHMLDDPRVDRILVLRQGCIVEDGTFAELSREGTALHELMQFSGMSSGKAEKPKSRAATPKAASPGQAVQRKPSTPRMSRRPSMASTFSMSSKSTGKSTLSRMTTDELKQQGGVSFHTLRLYFRFLGSDASVAGLITLIALFCVGEYCPDVWLSVWQGDALDMPMEFYLGVWVGVLVLGLLLMVLSRAGCALATARAATRIHAASLHSLVQCTLSFFESTPSGRILNRFGEDQFLLDVPLGMMLEAVAVIAIKAMLSLVLILTSVPWVAITVVLVLPLFRRLWQYQRATTLEATRFHLMSKSPLFNAFEETLSGLPTIQAFGEEERFRERLHVAVDRNISWLWTKQAAQTCCEQWFMLLVSLVVATAATCIVLLRGSVVPAAAALGLIYVILLAEFMRFLFSLAVQAESSLAVLERTQELLQTPHEAPRSQPADGKVQLTNKGASVTFKNVVMRYREHLDPALDDLTFTIAAGERVGIVGRSGSGKSTLLTALLRIVEISEGEIYIGPYKTADLGLRLLRQLVTIIPQDPVLFSGSVRWNLDPTAGYDDGAIRLACSRCGISDTRETFGLDEEVREHGSNFSVGERQLMCFARALLRCNPVMLFDEATASIDVENDARLQRVLREDFRGSTILTVAHRLGTIADSDRILALAQGKVAEFDSPAALIAQKDGVFAGLAREAGLELPAAPGKDGRRGVDAADAKHGASPLCVQDVLIRFGLVCH